MSDQACPRCVQRGQTWSGDDPKCAFSSGTFSPDNWNCATANALRDEADSEEHPPRWSEDQYGALVPWEGRFIVLSWYKHRGRTEGCWLMNSDRLEPLSLEDAEHFLRERANAG